MDWDAIGALGEVFGATAVVVSVVYLATQVRKQTEEARLTASRELADQLGTAVQVITEDGAFAEIWLKGVRDYESLPEKDRIRISFLFQRCCRILEQHHRHTSRDNLDVAYNQSVDNQYSEFLSLPGVQQWWETSKAHFERDFRAKVEMLVANTKGAEFASTFKSNREPRNNAG